MTKYNIATLANGLRIIHLPSSSKVVYCGIGINAGARQEAADEDGLAHFCEHTTFKGTQQRSAIQILNSLESVGGDLNAFTNKEDTVFYAAILKDHLNKAVDLLCDIVFCSIYPEEEIRHEVDVICDEIESYNDSPAELIYDEFENMIFQNHPLGHNILGTRERVLSFTGDDARRFTQRYYRPANAIFFAYGDVDFKKMVQRLERCMEQIGERNNRIAIQQPSSFPLAVTTASSSQEHHQAHIMLGSRAYSYDDERRLPLYLLNNLLGGPGMNARLNLSLRERHGLVYTVESTMVTYGDTGIWSIYFGCDHHDVNRCRRLVRHELDRLMQKPLSQRQLMMAKRQLKGQLAIACDNREQFALDFGRSYLHHGHERDLETLYQRIDAITAEELQTVACDLFAPDHMTTLIIK